MLSFLKGTLEFLRRRAHLGEFSGIPIHINYSWFPVFVVLSFLLASSIPTTFISSSFARLVFGAFTVVIFFGTLLIHEFAHAVMARREGIAVNEILLHPFGGVANLHREPETPGEEFRIAVAGPIASLIVAIVFLALFGLTNWSGLYGLSPLLFLLFLLNLFVAVFNLFPGFPLDGGRLLRSILWRSGMEFGEATILTGKFGQVIGATVVVLGILMLFLSLDYFTGLWSIIVGLFLLDSATGFIRRISNFENLIVKDVMELPVSVSPDSTVMECVDRIVPFHQHVVFPAATNRQLYGFLVLEDIKTSLPNDKWRTTLVRDVMRAVKEEYFIETDRPVGEARDLLKYNGLGALGVIDKNGKLVGYLQHGRIRRRN